MPFLSLLFNHLPLFYIFILALAGITLLAIYFSLEGMVVRYKREQRLMTQNEQRFFFALLRAVNKEYFVFSKVRTADILSVQTPFGRRNGLFWRLFIPLLLFHTDFVLCRKTDFAPVLAIELDDRSHKRKRNTIRNDRIKERAFRQAQMPLLRFKATYRYNEKDIAEKIFAYLPHR